MQKQKQRKTSRFFMEDDIFFRREFNQVPSRCISGDEIAKVLKEVCSGDCGKHQGCSRLFKQMMHFDYYWPTKEVDASFFV